jgi:hypothetical protein
LHSPPSLTHDTNGRITKIKFSEIGGELQGWDTFASKKSGALVAQLERNGV